MSQSPIIQWLQRIWERLAGAATAAKQLPNNHDVNVTNSQLSADLGEVPGVYNRSITGFTVEGIDSGSPSDIWPGADGAGLGVIAQSIWVKPTAAQAHSVVSDDAADTAAGTGLRTAVVTGLVDWNTPEVSEIVTLNGLTPVNTANSYVCVNDITVVTCGTAGPNVGNIFVNAVTDGTTQAVMRAGDGRSTRAIYAFPSTQKIVFKRWAGFINRASGTGDFIELRFLVDLTPTASTACWINADQRTVTTYGSSAPNWPIDPPPTVQGPAILKVQGEGSRNNLSGGASFGFYLVDK